MVRLLNFGSQEAEEENSMNIELKHTESSSGDDSLPDIHAESNDTVYIDEGNSQDNLSSENPKQPPAEPSRSALVKKILALQKRRSRLTARQRVAILIGILPVAVCSLEMIPERCHICRDDMELDAYFFTAAICGGFAAVIYGDSLDYWMPRLLGGSISALGSLFTIWMLLTSIPSKLAFLFFFVGILGAMPGIVIYFILKIVVDECFASELDDYDEIAPLTQIRITSAD